MHKGHNESGEPTVFFDVLSLEHPLCPYPPPVTTCEFTDGCQEKCEAILLMQLPVEDG